MKRILFLLFLGLSLTSLASNEVIVTGRVNCPETLVRLMVYDDLLNMHETQVAATTSDAQGFFLLEGKIPCFLSGRIAVGLESVDLFLTPGASYDVTIIIPEQDPHASYFERLSPTLRVKTASDKGAYRQIIESEQIIGTYVLNYFDELYRRHQYRFLDSIKAAIDAELKVQNEVVQRQNDYKIASVQMAVNGDGGKKVIKEFFDGKPVLYHCTSYMDLFKDLFSKKFWQSPYLMDAFQDAFWAGPKTFKEYLDTDPFMARNPRLAEMITIYNLRTMYYEQPTLRKAVKDHLKALRDRSSYAETKTMVNNMLARFDRFAKGADAIDFELTDAQGNKVKLADYKNSLVVLQFVEGSSKTVDHQLETLAELHRQWGAKVQLLTITTKDQLAVWERRFQENHYDWPLLNLGNDILLLEQYEVYTFPDYFIILPGNKFGMAPAPSPDQTLGEYVDGML